MPEKAPFPYPEHKVEVDPAKEVPAFDAATYEALMSLSHEEIEARAGEFGITPNSGIIPIEVDGQRRFIDTSVNDFGTNVRNVVEIVKQASVEADTAAGEVAVPEELTEALMAEHDNPEVFAQEADAELDRQVGEMVADVIEGADAKLANMDYLLAEGVANMEAISSTLQVVYHEVNEAGYRPMSPQSMYGELETIANTLQTVRSRIDTTFNGIGMAASPLNQLASDLSKVKQELDQKVAEHGEVRDQAEDNGAVEVEADPNPKVAKVAEFQGALEAANEKIHGVLAQANVYNQTVISIMQTISDVSNSLSYGGAPNADVFYQINEMISRATAQTGESSTLQQEAYAVVVTVKATYAELVAA